MATISKALRRIWGDISHGENLDAYIIIVMALLLSGASILGFENPTLLPGVTLAVLTLITVSTLVSRHRIEDLREQVAPSVSSPFLEEFPNSITEDIEVASELWLVGASLDDLTGEYYSTLERKLRQRHTIHVLVMNPAKTEVLQISDMRAYANPSAIRASQQITSTLDDLCALKTLAQDNLIIRVIDFPIPQRMIVANPSSNRGRIYVANYPFQTPGGSLPKFVVKARDTKWFSHFKQEAVNLWESGKEWRCPQVSPLDENPAGHK